MKTTIWLFNGFLALLMFASCSKGVGSGTATPPPPTTNNELVVSFSKNEIAADGFDEAIIKVKDLNNADVTNSATIYINDVQVNSTIFFTSLAGNYTVRAVSATKQSAAVIVKAVAPPAVSPFTQKVLAEFFTGTWCGICPGTIIPLDNYTKTQANVISVGVHGPNGSGDPFQYTFDSQLRSAYSVSGVPTVLLNRNSKWDNNTSSLSQLAQQRAALGLAFETSISGAIISVKAKVKFDVSTSIPLKIIVMLVEDGILYNQANYGHFGLPNPIVNFRHKNILRTAGTDIFGDVIPAAQQIKGSTWEKSLSFNASAYDISNCYIVATVIYGTNTQNRKGALNTQIVAAGLNKDFD